MSGVLVTVERHLATGIFGNCPGVRVRDKVLFSTTFRLSPCVALFSPKLGFCCNFSVSCTREAAFLNGTSFPGTHSAKGCKLVNFWLSHRNFSLSINSLRPIICHFHPLPQPARHARYPLFRHLESCCNRHGIFRKPLPQRCTPAPSPAPALTEPSLYQSGSTG